MALVHLSGAEVVRSYRPPRQQSAKARATEAILREARFRVFKRDNWQCRIALSPDCTGRAEEVHHVRSRAQGGSHEDENLISACMFCHRWCHTHPALAREAGVIA